MGFFTGNLQLTAPLCLGNLGPMDPASPARFSKQGKGALIFAMGLLAGIGIASVAIGWTGNRSKALDSPAVMNIGDGSGMMGREILAAAVVLSGERGMRIEFSEGGKPRSIFVIGRFPEYGIEIDVMSIRITPWKFEINDEEVSLTVLRERLLTYGRAAKLTDSRPILSVSCADGVDGTKLVEVFSILADSGIETIRIPDRFEISEPRPTPLPEPPIKPLAHPVELK